MGSAVRISGCIKSNIKNLVREEAKDIDWHIIVKDLYNNQTKMDRQQKIVTQTLTSIAENNYDGYKGNRSGESQHRCWFHENNTHPTHDCQKFRLLNDNEKIEMLKRKGLC